MYIVRNIKKILNSQFFKSTLDMRHIYKTDLTNKRLLLFWTFRTYGTIWRLHWKKTK